ncbi:MAG TPA: methyltransferase domain-containing protein [Polyangiaceae bacterium]|nr:methyltransferase domain-containing protein [Polyangiaceae bacterium]
MVSLALDSRQLAETYDRVGERQFNHGKELVSALGIGAGQRVLDVGAGTGRLAAHIAGLVGPTGHVAAVDPLPLRIALAQKRAPANLEARVGEAEDLSGFAERSFDVVILNSVFHWLPEKLKPLREALRVLKPGGHIGISTAAADAPHDFELILKQVFSSSDLADVEEIPSGTTHKVSSGELRQQLLTAGFTDVQLEIKTFVDHFDDTDAVFAFNNASSFGNFLSSLTHEQRALAHALLGDVLERRRTAQGIRLERHLSFAVAKRAG